MSYKELKIIKFNNYNEVDNEYQKRLSSIGVIKTEMYPYLMKRREPAGHRYPLFVVPLLDIQLLSQTIQEQSQTIQKLSSHLPFVAYQQFYKEQLFKSIVNSNEIEGVKTTRKEVSDAFQLLETKQDKPFRLLSTVRMYNDILNQETFRIDNLRVIRDIYDRLTEGEIALEDQLDGQLFRGQAVSILDEKTGNIEHLPPSSEESIMAMLSSWLLFINQDRIPFLIKAVLGHYFFENIHPFYDGNGRTGRYILSRYLARKLDIFSGLVISEQINSHRKNYYKAFKVSGDVDNRAEGTFFVLSLLELLKNGQKEVISLLQDKHALLNHFSSYLEEAGDSYTQLQKEILFLVFQSTIFVDNPKDGLRDSEIIDILSSNYHRKTIKDNIKFLQSQQVIEQTTKSPSRHILIENWL